MPSKGGFGTRHFALAPRAEHHCRHDPSGHEAEDAGAAGVAVSGRIGMPAKHRAPSPYSSDKVTNVLFVCSANRLRSPTAEQIFSTWPGIETDSAGISNGANVPLSSDQVEWADIIFVMEKTHRTKLNRKFRSSLKGKRIICLDIPDGYEFMDPILVRMLESRAGRFLSRPALPAL
jgi:predicted protein tyrosine phosphatase